MSSRIFGKAQIKGYFLPQQTSENFGFLVTLGGEETMLSWHFLDKNMELDFFTVKVSWFNGSGRNEFRKESKKVSAKVILTIIAWKVSKYGVFSGPYIGKYGPEKPPYFDICHAVHFSMPKTYLDHPSKEHMRVRVRIRG